jgi:hypothetical protein
LDAFWARIPVTVKSNLTLMLRIVKVQEEAHGIPRGQMFHPQGPHPLEDIFGMMTAVVLLDHSLNAGINAATVPFFNVNVAINVPGSTVLKWELVLGSMNQGHHRDAFKPDNEPS